MCLYIHSFCVYFHWYDKVVKELLYSHKTQLLILPTKCTFYFLPFLFVYVQFAMYYLIRIMTKTFSNIMCNLLLKDNDIVMLFWKLKVPFWISDATTAKTSWSLKPRRIRKVTFILEAQRTLQVIQLANAMLFWLVHQKY